MSNHRTEEIDKLRQEADGMVPAFRSCWNCNPCHENLKEVDYLILCFECNRYFYKGQCLTPEIADDDKNG